MRPARRSLWFGVLAPPLAAWVGSARDRLLVRGGGLRPAGCGLWGAGLDGLTARADVVCGDRVAARRSARVDRRSRGAVARRRARGPRSCSRSCSGATSSRLPPGSGRAQIGPGARSLPASRDRLPSTGRELGRRCDRRYGCGPSHDLRRERSDRSGPTTATEQRRSSLAASTRRRPRWIEPAGSTRESCPLGAGLAGALLPCGLTGDGRTTRRRAGSRDSDGRAAARTNLPDATNLRATADAAADQLQR